jgi:hypothetical protein
VLARIARIAPGEACLGERAKMGRGRLARGHDLARILVVQLVERKAALRGVIDARRHELRRLLVDAGEPRARAQVALAVRVERVSALGERLAQADRRHRVLERAARAHVHVHVAGGDRHEARRAAEREKGGDARTLAAAREELDRHARPRAEHVDDEARLAGAGHGAGDPQRRAAPAELGDVVARGDVVALGGAPPRARDQLREVAVAFAVDRMQHELHAVVEREFAADDERKSGVLRGFLVHPLHCGVRAHDAGERALVRDRERRVAEARGALDELLGLRRAAQERERRQAVELGVGEEGVGQHTVHIYGITTRNRFPRPALRGQTAARGRHALPRGRRAG